MTTIQLIHILKQWPRSKEIRSVTVVFERGIMDNGYDTVTYTTPRISP